MPSLKTLANFDGTAGRTPFGGVTADAEGNLFGTTLQGGADSEGTLFELPATAGGFASTPVTLFSFDGANGQFPTGSLAADAAGNLYGTTLGGGPGGAGVVFQVPKIDGGYADAPVTLASFSFAEDGGAPFAGPILDAAGNLFGTTSGGGTNGFGTVFKIDKTALGYAAAPTTLISFDGSNGRSPDAGLMIDAAGNLFGTTVLGGEHNAGTVFEILMTPLGYASEPTTLVSFDGSDGQFPESGLIMDADGNLFGTTSRGGANGAGTVFEILNTSLGYAGLPITLVDFNGNDGRSPEGSLLMDAAGDLFGTTSLGGTNNAGTVFEIPKTALGYASVPTTLASFGQSYGITPRAGLIADASGNLLGTTLESPTPDGGGTVFQVTDSGYHIPCYVAGTHLMTPAGETLIESLMPGDLVQILSGPDITTCAIRWIGHRHIDLCRHPQPETVTPIRIRPHAIGPAMPHRDLLVSPDHAILVEGKLICARQLVNGTTVCRETGWRSVTYYHVELDHHAILMAEGLPAESYINTGNCSLFADSPKPLVLHPDLTDAAAHPTREAASCAPFASAEADVRPIWQHVADRSAILGYSAANLATTTDACLHLRCGSKRIEPIVADADRAVFVLPPGLSEVQIVSRAQPPSEARPWLEDRRRLGVRINRIVLRDSCELSDIPLDNPRLTDGWWAVETEGRSISRWTNGCALLPLPELSRPVVLEIQLAGTMLYTLPIAGSAAAKRPVAA